MEGDVVWSLKWIVVTKTFREYLDSFIKIFLNDFTVYSDMESYL
jgi:hypothetical protein